MVPRRDVANQQQVQEAVDSTLKRFGQIDVLININNAGRELRGAAEEASPKQVRSVFAGNLGGLVTVDPGGCVLDASRYSYPSTRCRSRCFLFLGLWLHTARLILDFLLPVPGALLIRTFAGGATDTERHHLKLLALLWAVEL